MILYGSCAKRVQKMKSGVSANVKRCTLKHRDHLWDGVILFGGCAKAKVQKVKSGVSAAETKRESKGEM